MRQPFVRLTLRAYAKETYTAEEEEGDAAGEGGMGEGEVLVSSGEKYIDLSIGETCAIEGFDLVGGEEYVLCVERLGGEDDEDDEGGFVLDFLADGELEPIEI